MQIEERVLTVTSKESSLDIAAFAGPVGGALTRVELSKISEAAPDLVIMFGGLGDSEADASASLAGLAALAVPTLFIAGGADHREVIEDAFDGLSDKASELVLNASGLRELRYGQDSFAVVSGAALGRYARDDDSCGFDAADLEALSESLEGSSKQRLWLLSWEAPAGWGLTRGIAATETGSPLLQKSAEALKVKGGLFGYPEGAVATATNAPGGGLALVVSRLGRTGATRANGGRVASGLSLLTLGPAGLSMR